MTRTKGVYLTEEWGWYNFWTGKRWLNGSSCPIKAGDISWRSTVFNVTPIKYHSKGKRSKYKEDWV